MAKKKKDKPVKEKPKKDKKQKRTSYKPVESTQQNIPVKDFSDGIIITKDNKYVKMIEVEPQPFFLKKNREQNKVHNSFMNLLKGAPEQLHIKSIAVQADLSYQIEDIKEHIANETNDNCKQMGKEYLQRLYDAQEYGVTRKFVLSYPFMGATSGLNKESYENIVYNLNVDASRLESDLKACGNEIIEKDNIDAQNAEIYYILYNRDCYLKEPFSEKVAEVYTKYFNRANGEQPYVPPLDLIAPKKISYDDSKYLVVNDTFYSFLYIPSYGYNPNVYTGWLDIFVNSYIGVDVDVFLKRVPREEVSNKIRRSIGHSGANLYDTKQNSEGYDNVLSTLTSANYLKDGLRSGQDFYYMATLITVSGVSPEDVTFKANEIKKAARKYDIVVNENKFQMEKSFQMTLPNAMWDEAFFSKMKRNVLTAGAASTYMFTTFQVNDKEGLYIADDRRLNSPVLLDVFDKDRVNNPHIFINGETGAGKTVTVMEIALRARVKNMPVFILVPEKQDEFRRLVNAIGGQFVSIGSGSPQKINIMEIFKKDERSIKKMESIDGVRSDLNTSYLGEKISTLLEFVQIFIPDLSIEEKQLLNEAIIETYESFGITRENDSLWADAAHTTYKEMPILSDLITQLEKSNETRRLARSLKLLTTGAGEHFNGKTNVNVNNDFFVIGLENNTKEMLGLSIYMAMDYCWSKIKEDRTRQCIFIMDEWWKMAFNPIAAERSLEITKLARAYSCSVIIATQQMSDILGVEDGKYGYAVLNNCATNILLRMKYKDVMSVSEMVDLSKREEDEIVKMDIGCGLLIAGETRMMLHFTPSETEKLLTFTDKKTLERYAEMEEYKKIKKAEQDIIDNAPKLDEMFGSIVPELDDELDRLFKGDES